MTEKLRRISLISQTPFQKKPALTDVKELMASIENLTEHSGEHYHQALAGEGEYWDNFIAQRLLAGQIPGSIDWRLAFTQFRYNHDWRPFCLGPELANFRLREI